MANTSSDNIERYIWQVFAPQVNHIFGYFATLEEAKDAACMLYEPEMREELSFLRCVEEDETEVHLVWSEPLHECYRDPAELEIRQIRLGQIRSYTAPVGQKEKCETTN